VERAGVPASLALAGGRHVQRSRPLCPRRAALRRQLPRADTVCGAITLPCTAKAADLGAYLGINGHVFKPRRAMRCLP
jgi:hypothetical protein